MQVSCGSEARRSAVRDSADWNGIDYLEVRTIPENRVYKKPLIILHCFKALPAPDAVTTVSALSKDNVLFSGGVREKNIVAEWAYTAQQIITNHTNNVSPGELEFLKTLAEVGNPKNLFVIRPSSRGDFSTYRLNLVESVNTPGEPPTGFDIILSQVEFSFKVECPSNFDCTSVEVPSQKELLQPAIDYMAKDYASFRRLILDRLSLLMPDWKERNPADIGTMLVELMAYVGDHLSYYQDAAATETYLGTARRRISAKRHARLLDYAVHDGCNARVWICFEIDVEGLILFRKTRFLTETGNKTSKETSRVKDVPEELIRGSEVFESMYSICSFKSKNKMSFYTWGETNCWLPVGSSSATINGTGLDMIDVFVWESVPGDHTNDLKDYLKENFSLHWVDMAEVKNSGTVITISSGNHKLTITLQQGTAILAMGGEDLYAFSVLEGPDNKHLVKSSCLRVGDVLLFVEEMSKPGGVPDLNHRHAIRITSIAANTDSLTGINVLNIEWEQKDALPFTMCLEKDGKSISTIYGNVVLADHGYTKTDAVPSNLSFGERKLKDRVVAGKYYPKLEEKTPLTRCGPNYETIVGKGGSASSAFEYSIHDVIPALKLEDANLFTWKPARELFSGDEFARTFVVETESDFTVNLRFSDKNREDWARQISNGTFKGFTATYRVGNGSKGNVGAESITRIEDSGSTAGVIKVFNPLPAKGGEDEETIDSIRFHAPQAFRRQERAVTAADYEEILKRHPQVQRASAQKRWTGSWYTMFVSIDRIDGLDVNLEFEKQIIDFLESYRLAGYDVEINSPIYVPLEISIEVCLKDGYFWGEVREELLKEFGNKRREYDGRKGFFHPDNFTFGQRLYLSRLYQVAIQVAGVSSVIVTKFHRWGKGPLGELDRGYIDAGPREILRLDNDPNFAERGVIEFSRCGGS